MVDVRLAGSCKRERVENAKDSEREDRKIVEANRTEKGEGGWKWLNGGELLVCSIDWESINRACISVFLSCLTRTSNDNHPMNFPYHSWQAAGAIGVNWTPQGAISATTGRWQQLQPLTSPAHHPPATHQPPTQPATQPHSAQRALGTCMILHGRTRESVDSSTQLSLSTTTSTTPLG